MIEKDPVVIVPRPQTFRKLLIDNPMQMEAIRFRRRFINVTQSPKVNQMLSGLAILSYLLIVGIVFAVRADLPVVDVLVVQQLGVMLIGIVAAHAAIAGERDRRSWDLLQVAPITQHQIVVGKFKGVVSLIVALQLAFLPAALLAQIFGPPGAPAGSFLTLLSLELLCYASSSFAAAATIHLSSRLKSANATLVVAISSAVGLYAVLPMLISALLDAAGVMSDIAMQNLLAFYHPLFLIFPPKGGASYIPLTLLVSFAYLGLTVSIIAWTGRRLTKLRRTE